MLDAQAASRATGFGKFGGYRGYASALGALVLAVLGMSLGALWAHMPSDASAVGHPLRLASLNALPVIPGIVATPAESGCPASNASCPGISAQRAFSASGTGACPRLVAQLRAALPGATVSAEAHTVNDAALVATCASAATTPTPLSLDAAHLPQMLDYSVMGNVQFQRSGTMTIALTYRGPDVR